MSAVAPAWSPTTEQMHSSRLWRFMRAHQCATYPQLCERAAGLSAIGVARGVAAGLYLPVVIENAVALLACTKLGAVAVPLFSGFGTEAIRQRLADADARVLITADGAMRRGRVVAMKPIADQAAAALPQLGHQVVVACAGIDVAMQAGRDLAWDDLARPQRVPTEAMRADEPLLLLYTSGTTGRPKGTVHGHAGLPIKAAQDWALGMDVRPAERVMWVTDMGWVMGPLLLFGSLMLGGTAVFYDGAPDFPEPRRVWSGADRNGVTHLGISPTLTRVLMASGERAVPAKALSQLRVLASTGEPWTPEAWSWLFEVVGRGELPIMNYSGGTECGGGLVCGNFLTPSRAGSFAGPIPGIDAAVFNEGGQPVRGEGGGLGGRLPCRSGVGRGGCAWGPGRGPARGGPPRRPHAASNARWGSPASRRGPPCFPACPSPATARSSAASSATSSSATRRETSRRSMTW